MVDFEWTVKFGDVLTVAGALFVGGSILYRRGGNEVRSEVSLSTITEDIKDMKMELKKLSEVVTTLAVQDIKITNLSTQYTMLQKNFEDLRRGTGYVGSPARGSIDGEYS